uniref:Gag protein n=1 Tax=Human immunodeficiency virus type 1 TaxID=11676 RepID=K0GZW9_HV1|nr:gag protein [Human immunodeficiency virus 1]
MGARASVLTGGIRCMGENSVTARGEKTL